ncbi:ATP-binding protein [Oceanibaculum indicum]|uniref:Putative anti-sigma regulatory factor n=1 Tax=Oceanibaculum indicum P24 TaxID=1207063 RepID=K2K536_9PROT|nr:ATP-binding protein [Oceanibaculum indicum]EKE78059.1 putative anti-sigma regulatory factor [Oceanibaculum indicum P24]
MAARLEISIANDRNAIPEIVGAVTALIEENGLAPDIAYAIELAIDELVTNAISYGYPDGAAGTVTVEVAIESDRIVLVVRDDGIAFDPLAQAPEPTLEGNVEDRPVGGLGLHLVEAMMDEVAYERRNGENRLTCVKRR